MLIVSSESQKLSNYILSFLITVSVLCFQFLIIYIFLMDSFSVRKFNQNDFRQKEKIKNRLSEDYGIQLSNVFDRIHCFYQI